MSITLHTRLIVLFNFLLMPLTFAAAQKCESIHTDLAARFARHANGKIVYERKVYYKPGLKLADIKDNTDINTQWATNEDLKIWDDNTCWYENHGYTSKYRIDAVNKIDMNTPIVATTSTMEGLNQALALSDKDYDRTYILDKTIHEHLAAYRFKQTNDTLLVTRYKDDIGMDLDKSAPGNSIWPLFCILYPFQTQDNALVPIQKITNETPKSMQCRFANDHFEMLLTVDRENSLPLHLVTLSDLPNRSGKYHEMHFKYYDYVLDGIEPFPSRVVAQYYLVDSKAAMQMADRNDYDSFPMIAATTEFSIKSVDFDNPEYSKKISIEEFAGEHVEDFRFDGESIMYDYRPNMTDQEILAQRSPLRADEWVLFQGKNRLWVILSIVATAGAGLWWYRMRREEG